MHPSQLCLPAGFAPGAVVKHSMAAALLPLQEFMSLIRGSADAVASPNGYLSLDE
jgi:hypothetical protein